MADEEKEVIVGAGQEGVKALTTKNAVTDAGTLVRPKEPVVIIGTGKTGTGGEFLGKDEHTVHRAIAAKLVNKGAATYKNQEDKDKQAEYDKAEGVEPAKSGKIKISEAD